MAPSFRSWNSNISSADIVFHGPVHSSAPLNRCAHNYITFAPVSPVLSQARTCTTKIVPFRSIKPGHKIRCGGMRPPCQYNPLIQSPSFNERFQPTRCPISRFFTFFFKRSKILDQFFWAICIQSKMCYLLCCKLSPFYKSNNVKNMKYLPTMSYTMSWFTILKITIWKVHAPRVHWLSD